MAQAPARTGVWYAVAVNDIDRWTLRVSMTLDAEEGTREELHPPGIEAACDLLRLWYAQVTGSQP
ncbi:MAG: hypothetical protein ABWZ52_09830 [Acidimicrobiales bacterium]